MNLITVRQDAQVNHLIKVTEVVTRLTAFGILAFGSLVKNFGSLAAEVDIDQSRSPFWRQHPRDASTIHHVGFVLLEGCSLVTRLDRFYTVKSI